MCAGARCNSAVLHTLLRRQAATLLLLYLSTHVCCVGALDAGYACKIDVHKTEGNQKYGMTTQKLAQGSTSPASDAFKIAYMLISTLFQTVHCRRDKVRSCNPCLAMSRGTCALHC